MSRTARYCETFKHAIARLKHHTSFNIAACVPGYNILDPTFSSHRYLESSLEYDMRMEVTQNVVGVSLGECSNTSDPGIEDIIASFSLAIKSKPRDSVEQSALSLLAKHEKRMLATCSSSKKRRQQLEQEIVLAKAFITHPAVVPATVTPAPVPATVTTQDRLAFSLVSPDEYSAAREHYSRVFHTGQRKGEYNFVNTHPIYCQYMYTVLQRCHCAGLQVTKKDTTYVQYEQKSMVQLVAIKGHLDRIRDLKKIGDGLKEDYAYDTGEATERCNNMEQCSKESSVKRKRDLVELLKEKNAARKECGSRE